MAADGIVAGARIGAKGFATAVAMQMVGMLSRESEFQSGGDPKIAARNDFLIDGFTMGAAQEIRQI